MEGETPIYFGVKGQGHRYYKYNCLPFDNLYRRAYFVMHTFLVIISITKNCLFLGLFSHCDVKKKCEMHEYIGISHQIFVAKNNFKCKI